MKRLCSVCLVLVLMLTSCSIKEDIVRKFSFLKNDKAVATEMFETVIAAIQNRDKEALKTMFSKQTLDEVSDMDEKIDALFEYVQGKVQSYVVRSGNGGGGGKSEGRIWKYVEASFDVVTDEDSYRIAFQYMDYDSVSKDTLGIYTFYVIRSEDDLAENEGYTYWGDGQWTPGINIGKTWAGN